jgi:hypothetical protein
LKKRDKLKPCACCGVSTAKLGEHFYLKNEVWFKVHPTERGFLCIGCIESKLGRKLVRNDFTDASINKPQRGVEMSLRLIQRLKA